MNEVRMRGNLEVGVKYRVIHPDHAESLIEMTKWFEELITMFHDHVPSPKMGSKKLLTVAYCHELIESLGGTVEKKGSKDEDQT